MRNKIQIVDDNVALTTLLAKTLSKFGYETVVENNSFQALNTARYESPSLILLDVMMPGRDGGEVLSDLRNDPSLRPIPVILLTAIAREAQGLANMGGISSPVLSKPVQLMELLSTIENELTSSLSYTEEQGMIDMGPAAQPPPFPQVQPPAPASPFAQHAPPPQHDPPPASFPPPAAATPPPPAEPEPEVRNITPGGYTEAPGEPPFPPPAPAPNQNVPPAQSPPPVAHPSSPSGSPFPQKQAHTPPQNQQPQPALQRQPPSHPHSGHVPKNEPPPAATTNLFQFPKRENHRENVNPW